MILLIDNYDSFTFNLYQYLGELGEEITVYRNDRIKIDEIAILKPEAIILSPGPGRPENAGNSMEIIQAFFNKIPILGICLGHQAIGLAFGGQLRQAKNVMHGKTSKVTHDASELFQLLPEPLEVMRYHSLVIEKENLPKVLIPLSISIDDQELMAIKHIKFPVFGLQFHPESLGTREGKQILANFLKAIREENRDEVVFTKII